MVSDVKTGATTRVSKIVVKGQERSHARKDDVSALWNSKGINGKREPETMERANKTEIKPKTTCECDRALEENLPAATLLVKELSGLVIKYSEGFTSLGRIASEAGIW